MIKQDPPRQPARRYGRQSESGNVFFTLFGAVAIVGVLGAGIMATMRGPLTTMVNVNKRTTAESQMQIAAKLAMLEAATQLPSGDCDADGFVEPMEYNTAIVALGGGTLPASVGSNRQDPWGSDYGYCAWDAGTIVAPDFGECTGTLLAGKGDNTEDYPMLVIVSAGPDRIFQTTCDAYSGTGLTKGGDDLVLDYSYETASASLDGLWKIKSGAPDTAEINKELFVSGGARFTSAINLTAPSAQLQLGAASMIFPTQADLATCNGANDQLLRVNTGTNPISLEICDFANGGWKSVAAGSSLSPWLPGTGDDLYYNSGGNPRVGIGLINPSEALDVSGSVQLSGDLKFTSGGAQVIWSSGAGIGESTGDIQLDANGGGVEVTIGADSLEIAGDTVITGTTSGATNVDALTVEDNLGVDILVVQNDGNVGIGITNPTEALDVSGSVNATAHYMLDGVNVVTDNGTGQSILLGKSAGSVTTGNYNTILGAGAAGTLTTGTDNIIIGSGATAPDVPVGGTSNYLNIGDLVYGDLSGNRVGIGHAAGTDVTTFDDTLEINGTVDATGNINSDATVIGVNVTATTRVTTDELYVQDTNNFIPASCAAGKFHRWDGDSWECEDDTAGAGGGTQDLDSVLTNGNDAEGQDAFDFDQLGAVEFCDATLTNCFTVGDILNGNAGLWTKGAADDIYYNSGGTPQVGIGNIAPSEALHVTGTTRTDILRAGDGSFGTPSISFINDTNTGLYAIGADTIGISTAGGERIRITATGQVGIGATSITDGSGGGGQNLLVDIEGATGSVWYCDENGLNCFDAASVAGGTGTAPGSNRQVIFNSGGVFHAEASFTYTSTNRLVFGNSENLVIGGGNETLTGDKNTIVGWNTGTALTTGTRNTFVGSATGVNNTQGDFNTFIGQNAGLGNTTGDSNTALGEDAGVYNRTGSNNVYIGDDAGKGVNASSDVSNNTIIGSFSGANILTGGDRNTILGASAGLTLTTGADNILIGHSTNVPGAATSQYLNIGNLFYGDIGTTSTDPRVGTYKYCDETLTTCFTAADIAGGSTGAPGNDREIVFNSNDVLYTDTNFVFTSTGRLGIGTTAPEASLDVAGTDAILFPRGDGTNRPLVPVNGMMRYNSVSGKFEAFQGGTWNDIITTGGGGITFLDLSDTPLNYTGAPLFLTRVNAAGNGIEFVSANSYDQNLEDVLTVGNDANTLTALNLGGIAVGSATLSIGAQTLEVDVTGDIGAINYCDDAGNDCFTAADIAGGNTGAPGNDREVVFNSGDVLYTDTNFVFTSAGDLIVGSTAIDDIGPTGDSRMYFDTSNSAFRAGSVDGNQWNFASAGQYSTAFGRNTTASGSISFATGLGSTASGVRSIAMGDAVTASDLYSIGIGHDIVTSSDHGIALGHRVDVGNGIPGSGLGDFSMAIGLGTPGATSPRVTGNESLAIFMGNQDSVDITATNLLALMGGRMVIDPDITSATNTNVSTGVQQLELDVTGDIGAQWYCDDAGNNCFTAASVAGGGGTAPGNNREVIINDDGVFGTVTGFEFTSANRLVFSSNDNVFVTGGNDTTSGQRNTAIGFDALLANTTGDWNTAIGGQALWANTSGWSNTAVGFSTLLYNRSGTKNTAFGVQAGNGVLNSSDVYNNVFMGWHAGQNILTGGDRNTIIGSSAGVILTTGTDNILLGYAADVPTAATSNYLNIGGVITGDMTTANLRLNGTAALDLPAGTTGERPAGDNGMLRYNSDTNRFEGFQAGTWQDILTNASLAAAPDRGIQFNSGGAMAADANFIFNSAGQMLLGTNTPQDVSVDLQVHDAGTSSLYVTTDQNIGANEAHLWFATDLDGTTNWAGIGQDTDGSLRLTGQNSLSTPDMTITDTGQVGIGTTAPTAGYKLHIYENGAGINAHTRVESATGHASYQAFADTTSKEAWLSLSDTSGTGDSANILLARASAPLAQNDLFIGNSNDIFLQAGGADFVFRSTGALGVNTTIISSGTQTLELDVEGDVGAQWYCDDDGNNCFTAASVAGGNAPAPGNDREIVFNSNDVLYTSSGFSFSTSGQLLVNTADTADNANWTDLGIRYVGATNADDVQLMSYNDSPTAKTDFVFLKSRGVEGGSTIVADDDQMGRVRWGGWDGDTWERGASIGVNIDGTPADGDMPMEMIFSTTPQGSNIPVPRITIRSSGRIGIGTGTPQASLDVAGTDSILFPRGGTGVRPGSPVNGMMRYNSDNDRFEGFQGGTWQDILTDASLAAAPDRGIQFNSGGSLAADATFVYTSTGTLGINTANPVAELHVVDSADVDVNAYINVEGDETGHSTVQLFTKGDGATDLDNAGTKGWALTGRGETWPSVSQREDFLIAYWNGATWLNPFFIEHNTGNVGIGTATPSNILTISGTNKDIAHYSYSNTAAEGADYDLYRARGTSDATKAIVAADDKLGGIRALAWDSTAYERSAEIEFYVDTGATVADEDIPTHMRFSTRNATDTAAVERMRLTSDGNLLMYGTGAIDIPAGTTAQRPTVPDNGMIRYNSDTSKFEGFQGGIWTDIITAGAAAAAPDRGVQFNSGGSFAADANFVYDASGRLAIGTTNTTTGTLSVQSTTESRSFITAGGITVERYAPNVNSDIIRLNKARGAIGAASTVLANDEIGDILWTAHDGTAFRTGARIRAAVDGAPAAAQVPGRLEFHVNNGAGSSEVMRLTSAGRLGIGTTTPSNIFTVASASGLDSRFYSYSTTADFGADIEMARSVSGTVGVDTVVRAGDKLGGFRARGYDGTAYETGAQIEIYVDTGATVADEDMPTHMRFHTRNATDTDPVERMRLTSDGDLLMYGTGAIDIPAGTTGERPAVPDNGMLRYNSDTSKFEGFQAGVWTDIITAGAAAAAPDRGVQFNSGGAFTAESTFVYTSTGRLGIGTAAPYADFHIYGDGKVLRLGSGNVDGENFSSTIELAEHTNGDGSFRDGTKIGNIGTNGQERGFFHVFSNNVDEGGIDIDRTNGNVGINTWPPIVSLDVGGRTDAIRVPLGTDGERPASLSNGLIRYNSTSDKFEGYEAGAWVNFVSGGTPAAPDRGVQFNSGGAFTAESTFVYTSTGLLGIGTDTPEVELHIHKGSGANYAFITNDADIGTGGESQIWFSLDHDGTTNWAGLGMESDGSLRLTGSGSITGGMTITDSNTFGFGDETPDSGTGGQLLVDVEGPIGGTKYCDENGNNCFTAAGVAGGATAAGADTQIQINSGGLLYASSGLVYTSLGRLGIGTSAPAGPLHIGVPDPGTLQDALVFGNTAGSSAFKFRVNPLWQQSMALTGPYGDNLFYALNAGADAAEITLDAGRTPAGGASDQRISLLAADYVRIGHYNPVAATPASLQFWDIDGGTATGRIDSYFTSGSNASMEFNVSTAGPAMTDNLLVLNNNGRVGIGTATPATPFHIYNGPSVGLSQLLETDETGATSYRLLTAGDGATNLGNAATKGWDLQAYGASHPTAAFREDMDMKYWDGSTWATHMFFEHDTGNIGMGTSSPQAQLDVAGTGALITPRGDTSQRPAGVNGMLRYNSQTSKFEGYQGDVWTDIITAGGSAAAPDRAIQFNSGGAFAGTANLIYTSVGGLFMDGLASVDSSTQTFFQATDDEGTNALYMEHHPLVGSGSWTNIGSGDAYVSFQDQSGCCDPNTILRLEATSNMFFDTNDLGDYMFIIPNGSTRSLVLTDNGGWELGRIEATKTAGSNNLGSLEIKTDVDNQIFFSDSSNNGYIGMGTDTPEAELDVAGTGALITPRGTTAQRPAGVNGMLRYNSQTSKFEGYQGGVWTDIITAGGSPAGANSQIQFNSSGSFGANANFVWDDANIRLGIGTATPGARFDLRQGNAKIQIQESPGAGAEIYLEGNGTTGGFSILESWWANDTLSFLTGYDSKAVMHLEGVTKRVGIGTLAPQSALHVGAGDASNAAVTNILRLTHETSGAPANGIGTGIAFETETTNNNNEIGAIIEAVVTDNTSTSEDFDLVLKAMAGGAAANEKVRITSVGNVLMRGTGAVDIPAGTTAQRPAGDNGMLRYNSDTNKFEGFQAGVWTDIITAGGSAAAPDRGIQFNSGGAFTASSAFVYTAAGDLEMTDGDIILGTTGQPRSITTDDVVNLSLGANSWTSQLVLDWDGSVGIGTNGPTKNLEVSSGAATTIRINSGDISLWDFETNSGAGSDLVITRAGGAGNLILSSGGTYNVGIGESSPAAPLHITSAGDTVPQILLDDNSGGLQDNVGFFNNGGIFEIKDTTDDVRLIAVGIGTSEGLVKIGPTIADPVTQLEIEGTFKLDDGGEACDAAREGSIKYVSASDTFFFCATTANDWEALSIGGGGGTPAAPDRGIQFNSGGAFSAVSTFTYTSAGRLGIGTAAPVGLLSLYEAGAGTADLHIETGGSGISRISFEENGQDNNFAIGYDGANNHFFFIGDDPAPNTIMTMSRDRGSISMGGTTDTLSADNANIPNGSLTIENGALCVDGGDTSCDDEARTAGFIYGTGMTLKDGPLTIISDDGFDDIELTAYGINQGHLDINQGRGTAALPTVIVDDDQVGGLRFSGYDGNSFETGAGIHAYVDGVPGDDDMPMRLSFLTRLDNDTGNPLERMRIDSKGDVFMYGTGALDIPAGTTAQRPTGDNGMLRYNSDTNKFEGFQGGVWTDIITAGGSPAAPDRGIQFNSGGAFAASSNLIYTSNGRLSIGITNTERSIASVGIPNVAINDDIRIHGFGSKADYDLAFAQGTQGSEADVAVSNSLGTVRWSGYRNGDYRMAAYIDATVSALGASAVAPDFKFALSDTAGTVAEKMRITSDGDVGIGTTSPATLLNLSKSGSEEGVQIDVATNTAGWNPFVSGNRARGTIASPLTLQNNDPIFDLSATGYSNGAYRHAAQIASYVDAAPSGGDMPTRLEFQVQGVGGSAWMGDGASTPEMIIKSDGAVGIGTASPASRFVVAPPAVEVIAAAATITANACGTSKQISATANRTTNTTNTFTSPTASYAGCCMDVINVDTVDTITLDQNAKFFTGPGTDVALGPGKGVRVCSDGTSWYQAGGVSSAVAGGAALSGITAATGGNTIASGTNAQVWNWALTGATADAFTFGETTAATGGSGDQSVLKATTLASSTAIPLMVTNLGNGHSFRVNDATGDTDTSPFLINNAGQVLIGTATPYDASVNLQVHNETLAAYQYITTASANNAQLYFGNNLGGSENWASVGLDNSNMLLESPGSFRMLTGTDGTSLTIEPTGAYHAAVNVRANTSSKQAWYSLEDMGSSDGASIVLLRAGGAPAFVTQNDLLIDSTDSIYIDTGGNWGGTSTDLTIKNDGKIGIGTGTPATQLHVVTTSTAGNAVIEALRLSHEDSNSAAASGIGASLTFNLETATNNTFREAAKIEGVFDDADNNSKDGSLRFYTMGPNAVSGTTTTSERMRITSAGYVGIAMTNPSVALDVTGDIEYTGTITDVSDMRLKEDIKPLGSMLDKVSEVKGYSFRMKDDKKRQTEFGVMAQELEEIFPELVKTAEDEMGTKSVNYVGLIAPMIEATKELKAENENLKAELAAMKTQMASIDDLRRDIKGLKAHTGYGINKAEIGIWILVGMGFMGLIFVAANFVRTRRREG